MARRSMAAETLEEMPGEMPEEEIATADSKSPETMEEMPGETLYRVVEGYVSGHRQDYRPGHIVTAEDLVGDVRVYLALGVIAPLTAEPAAGEQGD